MTRSEFVHLALIGYPRSRGVYVAETKTVEKGLGSSPLARGLHHDHPERGQAGRIIPARAGFTRADDYH